MNYFRVTILSAFLFMITMSYSIAQNTKTNSLEFVGNNFFIPRILGFQLNINPNIANQFGVNYTRRISNNVRVLAGYSLWNNFIFNKLNVNGPVVKGSTGEWRKGSLEYRSKYKFVDVACVFHKEYKKSDFALGAGVSYAVGTNTYIDTIVCNPDPPYDGIIYSHYVREGCWGVVPFFSYDYMVIKKCLSLGGDLKIRKYFNLYSSQIDYGIHVKIHF